MFAGWLTTSCTQVQDARETPVRLLDVSLIVIGEGPIAGELVRRRREAGGRVCWLETQRRPESFVAPLSIQELAKPQSSRSAAWMRNSNELLDTQVTWDLSSFRWKPPSWRQRRWHISSQGVRWSLRHWDSSSYAWRTSGPEVVQLRSDEAYNVILGDEDHAPGLQVVAAKQEEAAEAHWEISGVVVFAGGDFGPHKGIALVCDSMASATKFDVSVTCEDAKPFVTVRPLHALAWAVLCLVQFFAYFVLMGNFEPRLRPEELPWWRASFAMLSIVPFGFTAAPDVIGVALTGASVDRSASAVMSVLCMVGQFFACVSPIGWIGDTFYTWPIYIAQCLAFVWYMCSTLPLLILNTRKQRLAKVETSERKMRWRAHIAWLMWTLTGTFGTWVMFYAVALAYIAMAGQPVISAIALPLMTSLVEFLAVVGTTQLYDFLILSARLKTWGFTTLGDQKSAAILPICMTHSYAESTRLVSMLVSTAKSPSFEWLAPLLLGFAMNVLLRTTNSTKLFATVVPKRRWWWILPDAGTVLHNEVRLCFGYPRFVSLLALGLANMVLHGVRTWPLFNLQATLLVVVAFFLEIVEDIIVTSGVLQSDSWKATLAPLYRGMNPLQPCQVMGFDKDGVQPSGPAIGFSGMRFLRFRTVIVAMAPACFFSYNLLTLLLGAGYVHGVCSAWIAPESRLIDGLVWWSPLRC